MLLDLGMSNIEKAVRSNHEDAIFDIVVTPGADTSLFPAGYNKWRKKFEIKVSSPAKDNKANREVITTVATFFNKKIEDVFIVSGKKNKNKTVLVKNLSFKDALSQLQESINE